MFLLLPIAFGNDQEALPLWREQGERESLAWEAGPGNEREGARRRARLRGQLDGLPDKRGDSPEHKELAEAPGDSMATEARSRGFFLKGGA